MKKILNSLFEHRTLGREESRDVLVKIASGEYNNSQVAAFLSAYRMRSITTAELAGFRDAMLELCRAVDLSDFDPIDVCGTGGDGKNTFNVSTLSAFVVAGAGIAVAKHGNYGVSSVCGSSNVLEELGVKFEDNEAGLRAQLDSAGICFMHAPLFHPAMKHVGPIRRELGVSTFFNMLGPIVNPANPNRQVIGVFSLELARLYSYLLQEGDKEYAIVHSLDGYDEISLTGAAKVFTRREELVLQAKDFGFEEVEPEMIFGGDTIEEATSIFSKILLGDGTLAQENVVIANAALAINRALPELSLGQAVEKATESLRTGKAKKILVKLTD